MPVLPLTHAYIENALARPPDEQRIGWHCAESLCYRAQNSTEAFYKD